MTLKDDIEAAHGMRDLWVQEGGDPEAAERVIALAERAANPALQALLNACEAVEISYDHDDAPSGVSSGAAHLADAILTWRAAKAEGFAPGAVERSGGLTPHSADVADERNRLRSWLGWVRDLYEVGDAARIREAIDGVFPPVEEMGPDV